MFSKIEDSLSEILSGGEDTSKRKSVHEPNKKTSSTDLEYFPIVFVQDERHILKMNPTPLTFSYIGGMFHESDLKSRVGELLINRGTYDYKYLGASQFLVDFLSEYFSGLKTSFIDMRKVCLDGQYNRDAGKYTFRFESGNITSPSPNRDELMDLAAQRNAAIKNKMMIDLILGIDAEEVISSLKKAGCAEEVVKEIQKLTETVENEDQKSDFFDFASICYDVFKKLEACLLDSKKKLVVLFKYVKILSRLETTANAFEMFAEEVFMPYELIAELYLLRPNKEENNG